MRYLHTMVRVSNLEESLAFYVDGLGLEVVRRTEHEAGRFTLVFLAAPQDRDSNPEAKSRADAPMIELTYNWDPETYIGGRNFGHLAFETRDIYSLCAHLAARGVAILRPPRDGRMAFIRSPDAISIELLQAGAPLAGAEPWSSMPNQGSW
jgi:lactoylglutathione lyase